MAGFRSRTREIRGATPERRVIHQQASPCIRPVPAGSTVEESNFELPLTWPFCSPRFRLVLVHVGLKRRDVLDADEPIWAFGAPSCVGSATNLQLRSLVLLTTESCCQYYCGRPADAGGYLRRLSLGEDIDADHIAATYQHGGADRNPPRGGKGQAAPHRDHPRGT